jgi:hypothetical protein
LLQRDIQDQVRDVDLLEEVLESINQELPDYLSTGQSLCSSEESLEEPILPTNLGTKES